MQLQGIIENWSALPHVTHIYHNQWHKPLCFCYEYTINPVAHTVLILGKWNCIEAMKACDC